MSAQSSSTLGINSWLEEELYQQYLHDRKLVDESWKDVFTSSDTAGQAAAVPPPPSPVAAPPPPAPKAAPEPAQQASAPVPAPPAPQPTAVQPTAPKQVAPTNGKALEVGPSEQLVPL